MRVPDPRRRDDARAPTVREVAERWQAARVDVAAGTLQTYRVALGRVLPRLGDLPPSRWHPWARIGELVGHDDLTTTS
jgi:hypothetical protein